MKRELGKFLFDIAKIVFGGALLGMLLNAELAKLSIFGICLFLMISAFSMGYYFIKQDEKKNE